jgi:uncharacterized protein
MTSLIHTLSVGSFAQMLRTLATLLDKGAQHAATKKFDPAVLMNARLAPDMFPLVKQVQIACDHAKNGTARLMGQEPPRFADEEQTLDDLKARIARTVDYVESAPASAFEEAAERDITLSLPGERVLELKGLAYLRDWALPHFYFHVVTAYDILRHNGVEIGKFDYLHHLGGAIRRRGAA